MRQWLDWNFSPSAPGAGRGCGVNSAWSRLKIGDVMSVSLRGVADGFDVVAVGVEHEGAVVVLVVVRPQPGRAVVGGAGAERGRVEGVDLRARVGLEAHVQLAAHDLAG